MKRPTRAQLVKTIGELQNLIGRAMAAYQNDRDPQRSTHVMVPLREAHELCIDALSADPPEAIYHDAYTRQVEGPAVSGKKAWRKKP